jgi:hypothetical protein
MTSAGRRHPEGRGHRGAGPEIAAVQVLEIDAVHRRLHQRLDQVALAQQFLAQTQALGQLINGLLGHLAVQAQHHVGHEAGQRAAEQHAGNAGLPQGKAGKQPVLRNAEQQDKGRRGARGEQNGPQ